jgi:malonyl-ACP decarboxylase
MLDGKTAFNVMQRPGRQRESAYIGAEIGDIAFPAGITRQTLRAASLSAQAALTVLQRSLE